MKIAPSHCPSCGARNCASTVHGARLRARCAARNARGADWRAVYYCSKSQSRGRTCTVKLALNTAHMTRCINTTTKVDRLLNGLIDLCCIVPKHAKKKGANHHAYGRRITLAGGGLLALGCSSFDMGVIPYIFFEWWISIFQLCKSLTPRTSSPQPCG